MPRYTKKISQEILRENKKRILEHVKREGAASGKSLGEQFGVKKVTLTGGSLRGRALRDLIEKKELSVVRNKGGKGKVYVLNEPELVHAADIAGGDFSKRYQKEEAAILLQMEHNLALCKFASFKRQSTIKDPVTKILKRFPEVIETGEYRGVATQLRVIDEEKFKSVLKTLKKSLELRGIKHQELVKEW